ncbi:MAG: hypothetical protein U9Q67_03980 [Patescibacteria group bacterium]|nr:hypothetical protein [Patescibacteria group bacterium]
MMHEVPTIQDLDDLSSRDIYLAVRTEADFGSELKQYAYEAPRIDGGLHVAEIVPCSGSVYPFLADNYIGDPDVIIVGDIAVGRICDGNLEQLKLFGPNSALDTYLFLAALACGGINGSEGSIQAYNPFTFLIIPVLERGKDGWCCRDILMNVKVAQGIAKVLEEKLEISK